MKKEISAYFGDFFLLVCLVLVAGCKKEDSTQGTGGPNSPTPDGPCNTWVCLSVGNDFTKQWISDSYESVGGFGASASAGQNVYMGGGTEEGDYNGGVKTVFNFNLGSLKFEWSNSLSLGRSHLAAAVAGQKVIFAGGKNENIYNRSNPELYDVADIFDQKNGARTSSRLSQPRAHIAAVSTGTKAYFMGGLVAPDKATSRVDVYDAAIGDFTQLEAPRPRAYAGAVAVNGRIYLAGGMDPANPGKQLLTIDVLDTGTGQWSSLEAPHSHPRASVVLADDKIFIAGGNGSGPGFVDIYDLKSGMWTSSELSDGRFEMAVAVMNDRVIFLGGNFSNAIDIYQIDQKKWVKGQVNEKVAGMVAGAYGNRSVFASFFYRGGYYWALVMWVLERKI